MREGVQIWTLGGLTIKRGDVDIHGQISHKAQALLVYLVSTGHPAPRQVLADLLWDKGSESQVMNSLRVLLTSLRQKLEPYVTVTRETVAVNQLHPIWLDLAVLEEGLAALRFRRNILSLDEIERLGLTLRLYQGDFLEGFDLPGGQRFEEWLLLERERIRLHTLEALNTVVSAALARGEYQACLEYVERLLKLDQLHDDAHRKKMLLLALIGQRHAALTQYEYYCWMLDKELGLPPDPKTTSLFEAIKANQLPSTPSQPEKVVTRPVARSASTFPIEAHIPELPPTVFVDRQQELAALTTALKLAQDGTGQLRFVTGGIGRGKTMLVREFVQRALSADPEILVVCGQCKAWAGQGDPNLPFQEILNVLTGDVQSSGAFQLTSHRQAKRLWEAMPITIPALVEHAPMLIDSFVLGQALQRRASTIAPDKAPWFKHLTELVAAGSQPQLDRQHIFSQYSAVLKAIASQRPLLLILEDMQWIDSASCSLLFHLSREVDQSRTLLVGTYRPDEVALGWGHEPHPLATMIDEFRWQHGDIWLDLGRMTEADGHHFVATYLDNQRNRLDEAFREALFQQTRGHPLFTVELVQALQERGDLMQDKDGYWVAAETIDWQMLPAKIEAVIKQRIHRLSDALQTTLNIASVEGETFTAEVVARVQGLEEEELIHQLSHTLDKQHRLVMVQPLKRLGQQPVSQYRFRHKLYQQYLYRHLDDPERAHLHEAVSRALQ